MSKYKVGEKFVVEIDKIFEQGGEKLYRAKGMKSLVFDENGLRKLTPLEAQIKRQAAEITRLLRENEELKAHAVYKRMVELSRQNSALKEDFEYSVEQARTEGQQEAWELLKTMGNMYCSDFEKIFKTEEPWCVVHECTYAEAAEKVAVWEKAKDEIRVGDVIDHQGLKSLVVRVEPGTISTVTSFGTTPKYTDNDMKRLKRTGCTLPVKDWLAQIGGGNENND